MMSFAFNTARKHTLELNVMKSKQDTNSSALKHRCFRKDPVLATAFAIGQIKL